MRNHPISLVLLFANPSSLLVDTVRKSLEATSEKWFIGLLVSSAVVALGCILEIGETWTDLKRWIRLKKDLPVEEENPKSWLVPIGAVGLLLVIVGVIGEGVFEGLASTAETALRAHDSQMLAQALHNAGDAKDSADKAATAADRANSSADAAVGTSSNALTIAHGARVEADSFEKDIVSTKTQAADTESHLADALQRAVAAEKEALELKEQLADRTLSDKKVESIAGKLDKFAGQEYDIIPYWDSPESVGIANRVHRALQVAHWKYSPPDKWEGLMGGEVGIKVSAHPQADESTLRAAEGLTLALQAEGLEAREELGNPKDPKNNKIGIIVGSKR